LRELLERWRLAAFLRTWLLRLLPLQWRAPEEGEVRRTESIGDKYVEPSQHRTEVMNTVTSERKSEEANAKVARPLPALVPLIKQSLASAFDAGLEHYRAAGEMLLEAKSQLRHGEWGKWLRKNFELSQESARCYMRLADSKRAWNFKTLSDFVRQEHYERNPQVGRYEYQSASRPTINAGVNVSRLRLEAEEREKERALQRRLGLQLVKLGYRALAIKLHPDVVGGSHSDMVRLQLVCERLKQAA
jgi:hypothetical protein